MSDESNFPARGKIIGVTNGSIVRFAPANTTYELHLAHHRASAADLPTGKPIDLFIYVDARKVYTVPSGGNFIQPIVGPPRIIPGRVRWASADGQTIIVHAGTNFTVMLPRADDAIDLNNGAIAVGKMVNVVTLPGARMELAAAAHTAS